MSVFKSSSEQPICDKHLTMMVLWDPAAKTKKEIERAKEFKIKGQVMFPHPELNRWFCVDCLEEYNAEQIKQGESPIALCFETLVSDKTEREVYGLEEKIH